MIIQQFFYSISITFGSWLLGAAVNVVLQKGAFYEKLTDLQFIKNDTINKRIGLGAFKWVVKNTFFKYFNQKLVLRNQAGLPELHALRTEMTSSEISHLIAFGLVAVFALVKVVQGNYAAGTIMMAVNILMNLYPSLLQQENKKRIDRLARSLSFYRRTPVAP